MAYPVDFTVEYGDGKRSRGLALAAILFFIKGILLIPHFIVVYILYIVAAILTYVGYWVTAFTGKLPTGMFNFIKGTQGWWARITAWLYGLTDEYPPFSMEAPDYPAQFTVEEPESNSRGLAVAGIVYFVKALMLIPHMIVLFFVFIAAWFVLFIGYFAVLFTGKYPEGMFNFAVGALRWQFRVGAWFAGLVDEYPPFSLE